MMQPDLNSFVVRCLPWVVEREFCIDNQLVCMMQPDLSTFV